MIDFRNAYGFTKDDLKLIQRALEIGIEDLGYDKEVDTEMIKTLQKLLDKVKGYIKTQ